MKLGNICKIKYGKDHKQLSDGNVPVYGSGGIMRYVEQSLWNKPSVLIPRKGTLDNLFFVDEPFWTVDTLFWTDIDENLVLPKYLYYQLKTKELSSLNVGTAVPSLTANVLNEIEINLPPLKEQKQVVEVLGTLDDKIAADTKLNGYLAELAQTIYNDWFRDFGHWGGQMPSHWETGVLGDYVTIKRGGSPRPIQEYLSDEGLRWLKIADVSGISGPYILEIKEHIKEEGLRKTVHLEPGSLVLSNSATPGIPKILSIDTCIHDGWLYFPQSQFTNEWLYCYFLNVRQELIRMANGSVFQNLKTDIVKNFEVIRPDDETLASFQEMVAPLFNLMESCQKENKQLADLRDTLLPKLMSGEIDVSQVDLTQLNSHLVQRVQIVSQSAVQPNLPSNLTDHPLVGNTLVSCSKPVLSIVEFRSVLHFMKVLDGLVKLPVEFLRGFLHRIKEDLVLIHPEQ